MTNEKQDDTQVKPVKKKRSKLRKIMFVSLALLIVAAMYLSYAFIGNFMTGDAGQNKGLQACQQVYSDNVDRFVDQTGLNRSNIVFGQPKVEERKSLYIYDFNNIALGDQRDTFICYYNTDTGKALDRTPMPDIVK